MSRRLLNIATIISAMIFCLTLAAWLMAGYIDPRTHFVSLSSQCHFSVDRGADARLEIFNDSHYGPYSGGIVGMSSSKQPGVHVLNEPRMWGFGDTAGIYFRRFLWRSGRTLWTLSISLAYPLAASAILPMIWFIKQRRASRQGFPVGTGTAIR